MLDAIRSFDRSGLRQIRQECDFRFLYDADIDFTGRCGAVMMYARQKGASEEELILLEEGMNNVAVRMEIGAGGAGLGAAGGAGGGLYAFLGAEGVRGIDIVLDAACFDVHLHNADLVITGEGKADAQTSQGKVAKGVLSRAARAGVPVALLAGRIDDRRQLCSEGYGHIADINENMDGGERTLDPLDPLVAADRLARASRRLASSLKM
jgi:glycerate kinase